MNRDKPRAADLLESPFHRLKTGLATGLQCHRNCKLVFCYQLFPGVKIVGREDQYDGKGR